MPELAISNDRVDPERLKVPQGWDIRFVRRFMIVFGLGSSLFDFITFGALLLLFHADERLFHTGWFIESLLSQMVVVLVLRTRRFAWQSRPGPLLVAAMACVIAVALALPYVPAIARTFGFVPLSPGELASLLAIVVAYLGATELLKHLFFRHESKGAKPRTAH